MPRVRPRQSDFSNGEITEKMGGRVDIDKYFRSAKTMENFVILQSGAAQRRPGSRYVATAKTQGRKIRMVRFEFSTTQAYMLEVGHLYIRFYANSGQVISGLNPLEVTTTYQESELAAMKFTQSADTLVIVHPSHAPAQLQRFSPTQWVLSDITFSPTPSLEFGTRPTGTLTAGALSGLGVTFTASNDSFKAADVKRNILVLSGTNAGAKATITTVSSTTVVLADIVQPWIDLNPVAAANWKLDASPFATATPSVVSPAGLAGVTVTLGTAGWRGAGAWNGNSDTGRFVLLNGGSFRIDTVTSDTVVTGTLLGTLNGTGGAPGEAWTLEEAAWSTLNGFPAATTFTDLDRLGFADTAAQPQTAWLSKSGDYFNFGVGILDDDAIIFTLNTNQVNAITSMRSARDLIFFTTGAEFVIKAPQDAALTPTNVTAKANTTYGSSATVDAVRVSNVILFPTRSGRQVREDVYEFATDTYLAPDLLLLASHLTRPVRLVVGGTITARAIIDMAYQREPISTLWGVRQDGALLGMTYLRDQNIVAWHRHILGLGQDDTSSVPDILHNADGTTTKLYQQMPIANDGAVESVATIPHPNGDREQVWLSVVRTVNGVVQRYIEVLDDLGHNWDYLSTEATITADGTVTTATLTPGGVAGTGVTFTASAPAFSAGNVGAELHLVPYAAPRAVITSFTNSQHVVATIPSGGEFPSLTPIAAGAWGIANFTFSGLTHLIGRTVKIVGDGAVFPDQTVSNTGSITNATAAVKVEVGLASTATLVTIRPEFPGGAGSAQGVVKRAGPIIVRFNETLGATLNGHPIPWRKSTDTMGAPPPLFSDDKQVTNLGYSRAGRVVIQQTLPLPITVELLSGVDNYGE